MRFLKILLYLILVFCIVWGGLIFGGSKIIEFSLRHYYGGSVEVSGLRVSPDLDVYASRLEFNQLSLKEGAVLNGSVRSVSFGWGGLFSRSPFLNLSASSVNLEGIGEIKRGDVSLTFPTFADFSNAIFTLNLEGLELSNGGSIGSIVVSSNYHPYKKEFSEIILSGDELLLFERPVIHAEKLQGKIEQIGFQGHLTHSKFNFSFETVNMPEIGVDSDRVTISSLGDGRPVFDVSLAGTNFDNLLQVEDIKIEADTKNLSDNFNLMFSMDQIELIPGKYLSKPGRINNIVGTAAVIDAKSFELLTKGYVDEIDIVNEGQFVANLSNINFEFDASFLPNGQSINSLSMNLYKDPVNFLLVTAELNPIDVDPLNCILQFCGIDFSELNYEIKTLNGGLSGISSCPSEVCNFNLMEHSIQTDETDAFVSDLLKMQILNPLIAAVFYGQLKAGKKLGNGHQVNF